ncbi:MAG: integration host factor subunit beta [Myxococcaceae bacterium]|nr:integration host factor subunit beta [Myxococcaceae bacterium]MBH2005977.1 integration host factor subunit beta [Myxococcaceae bacterium]
MLRSELIERLAYEAKDLSDLDVEIVVRTVLEAMSDQLACHGRIEIRGFGAFSSKKRNPRNAHNPKTGVKVSVPEKWIPFFIPGKELRERVNRAN